MNLQTQTELVQLSKENLLQRCLALQERLEYEHRAVPGTPQYILTPEGYLMWQESTITLSVENETLVGVPGIGFIISALGWEELNKILRVQVYNDASVRRIFEDGTFKAVEVKGAAIGCVGGVPQVTTLVLTLNFYEMFLRELTGLAEKQFTCARLGVKDVPPTTDKPWVFYKIEGDAGVWVDLSHDEVIKKIKTLQQRRQWPDRLAFAYLRRNLIRKFAGSLSQKVKSTKTDITIRGWYYPINRDRLERIAQCALKGEQADPEVELKTAKAEIIKDIDDASVEGEVIDEATGEVITLSVPLSPTKPQPQKPTKVVVSPVKQKALDAVYEGWMRLEKAQKQALKQKYPQTMTTYSTKELNAINRYINQLLDQQITEKEKEHAIQI